MSILITIFICMSFILFEGIASAQVMQSGNYRLESDSVNFGGARGVSGSYSVEDTMGEVATGYSSSTSYTLHAGFQQQDNVTLAVVPAGNVIMTPSIGGITGGIANGSTTFRVTTNDRAGYTVSISASSSPALVSVDDSFADYAPAGPDADFDFNVASAASAFGFSPEGADVADRFKNNGASSCGSGSSTAGVCWDGMSTTEKIIVRRNSYNDPTGTLTRLNFRAASGPSHMQISGEYAATTTLTILPL